MAIDSTLVRHCRVNRARIGVVTWDYLVNLGEGFSINLQYNRYVLYHYYYCLEASRGAAAQSVTVKLTGCGFDPHSRR